MTDISPGSAIGIFAGLLLGGVKIVGELLKARNAKRIERAYKDSAPTAATPAEPLAPPPTLSVELKLQAKEIELLRAQYQIDQLQADFRRLRQSLDDAAKDQARLAARLTEEELLNRQLIEEMAALRRGEDGTRDRYVTPTRDRRSIRDTPDSGDVLRTTRRPGDRKGR